MDLHTEAHALDQSIRTRNRVEVGLALVMLPVLILIAAGTPSTTGMLGFSLTAAGCLGVAVILGLFGRVALPAGSEDCASWRRGYIRYLDHQVRLLSTAPLWYVLPLMGGMLLAMWSPGKSGTATLMMVVGLGVWISVMNRAEARRLAAQRDALAA